VITRGKTTVGENAGGHGRASVPKGQQRILFVNTSFASLKGEYAIKWENRTGGRMISEDLGVKLESITLKDLDNKDIPLSECLKDTEDTRNFM
jgi:hypothetical protein